MKMETIRTVQWCVKTINDDWTIRLCSTRQAAENCFAQLSQQHEFMITRRTIIEEDVTPKRKKGPKI